jgi:hypothetical protein
MLEHMENKYKAGLALSPDLTSQFPASKREKTRGVAFKGSPDAVFANHGRLDRGRLRHCLSLLRKARQTRHGAPEFFASRAAMA